jgi:GTP-binding protein
VTAPLTPIIAIIGRPNVGKSTLFNKLTRTRNALVADRPGVTRDRQYGFATHGARRLLMVDTGGMGSVENTAPELLAAVGAQTQQAVREADVVLWLVDGRAGVTAGDQHIAAQLRPLRSKLVLVVNKIDGLRADEACADFHALGSGEPLPISAEHGIGTSDLMDHVSAMIPSATASPDDTDGPPGIRVSVLGRPNVGKSTLINRLLGEQRMLTSELPGTTRDSVAVPFERRGRHYVLIDTAGVRRRARVADRLEKASVVKSLRALENAQVVIAVLDAREGVTDQDIALIGLAAEIGKSMIIAINKCDGLDADAKLRLRATMDRKLTFADYACVQHISALHGTGVGGLFGLIDRIGEAQQRRVTPAAVTRMLHKAIETFPPPLSKGRRIKLRYAHLGGHDPLRVIVHGTQTVAVPDSYQRYLANSLREQLALTGTPVLVEFKYGKNPYAGKRNVLTKRQVRKRERIRRK